MSKEEKERILHLDFNQNSTCISMGTDTDFRIYNISPFEKFYEEESGKTIVEMLFSSSLLALVGGDKSSNFSPRKLQLFDSNEKKIICELNFQTTILNVHLSKKRVAVVLEKKIHIFNIANMKLLRTIDLTVENSKGISSLSHGDDDLKLESHLAYPYNSGSIMLIDMDSQNPVNVIEAHKGEIEILKFSQNGKLLASASISGTIIRIFSIPDCKLKYSFRRGSSSATIHDINFNKSSTMCCVGSNNGTIHIFKLEEQNVDSYFTTFGDMFQSTRAFSVIKNVSSSKYKCAFSDDEKYVYVITFEGVFLKFQLNFAEGGECKLVDKNNLFRPKFDQ
eukprot:gene9222-1308_t